MQLMLSLWVKKNQNSPKISLAATKVKHVWIKCHNKVKEQYEFNKFFFMKYKRNAVFLFWVGYDVENSYIKHN